MNDLRTRIATAIYNACDDYTRKLLVRPDCPGASELDGDGKPVCYVLADAVIEELALEQQAHYDPGVAYHRYVTDWETDDE